MSTAITFGACVFTAARRNFSHPFGDSLDLRKNSLQSSSSDRFVGGAAECRIIRLIALFRMNPLLSPSLINVWYVDFHEYFWLSWRSKAKLLV